MGVAASLAFWSTLRLVPLPVRKFVLPIQFSDNHILFLFCFVCLLPLLSCQKPFLEDNNEVPSVKVYNLVFFVSYPNTFVVIACCLDLKHAANF